MKIEHTASITTSAVPTSVLHTVAGSVSNNLKTKSEMAKLLRLLSDSLECEVVGGEASSLTSVETTQELHVDVESKMDVDVTKSTCSGGDMHSVSKKQLSSIIKVGRHDVPKEETASSPQTTHSSALHSSESHLTTSSPIQTFIENHHHLLNANKDQQMHEVFSMKAETERVNENSSRCFPTLLKKCDKAAPDLAQQLVIQTDQKIYKNASFASYLDFTAAFDEWKAQYNHPFRVASSEKFKNPDGTINQCAHYGEPRKRGNGRRPKQNYLPCGCKAKLRLNYQSNPNKMVVTTLRMEHNHEDKPAEFYLKSPKIKKVSPSDSHGSSYVSEMSPNSTCSKNESGHAYDSSSLFSPISIQQTSLFSPTTTNKHSPHNLSQQVYFAHEIPSNLAHQTHPLLQSAAESLMSQLGTRVMDLNSKDTAIASFATRSAVDPAALLQQQFQNQLATNTAGIGMADLLAILQRQQLQQQQQNCLKALLSALKTENSLVKPEVNSEFSAQSQFPIKYTQTAQNFLIDGGSTSAAQHSTQQVFLPPTSQQQQQQQQNLLSISNNNSQNLGFFLSQQQQKQLASELRQQPNNLRLQNELPSAQTAVTPNPSCKGVLEERLQQSQLSLLQQQNFESEKPLQAIIKKQMLATNMPINQQLAALQNSYLAALLSGDPMLDAARLVGILVEQIQRSKDVKGYLNKLSHFLDSS